MAITCENQDPGGKVNKLTKLGKGKTQTVEPYDATQALKNLTHRQQCSCA